MVSSLANDPERVARILLWRHSLALVSCITLQRLWAGYGQICAISAQATTDQAADHLDRLCGLKSKGATGTVYPLILKLISPPSKGGGREDEGHLRKILSYEVEQRFYSEVVPLLGDGVAVANCLVSTRDAQDQQLGGLMAMVMVDLRPQFPVAGEKRSVLSRAQVHGALEWLAGFHRRSWALVPKDLDRLVLPPLEESRRRQRDGEQGGTGLWLNGGYTYLATRRKEYTSLLEDTDSELSEALCTAPEGSSLSVAEMAALFLTPCGRSTESYIHGDVKSENLFTTADGEKVAFFDFQYVGLGLGVCDLAKLFTCSVPLQMLVDDADVPEQLEMQGEEQDLLRRYHSSLLQAEEAPSYEWTTFQRHWETALVDWCRFQASWGFWGNTEWLEARVRSILGDQEWRDWLCESVRSRTSTG